jgi:hypothetical protein
MPKNTREFFIPNAGSTDKEGPGVEVISNAHGVTIRRSDFNQREVFLEPQQIRKMIRVLEDCDADRQGLVDRHHADEFASGLL